MRLKALFAAICAVVVLVIASPCRADQSGSAASGKASQTATPDYSRKALLTFFRDVPPGSPFDVGVVVTRGNWRYRWLPIVAPIRTANVGDYRVNAMPDVNPFVLLGTDFPYTPGMFR
jgi:hypothetical protein